MDVTAAHSGFVIASYALSAIFIIALTIYILLKDRNLRNEARRLDRQRRKEGS